MAKRQSTALREALNRLTANHPDAQVWKATEERIVVWFGMEERVYVYEVPPIEEGRKLRHLPGRAILNIDRRDSSDEEFRKLCERLA